MNSTPAQMITDTPAPWLNGLNDPQYEAVTTLDGPLLVLAGAGTGKTRVLTTRFAHIVHAQGVNPWRILAVTFTNKAAREMKDRIAQLLGYDSADQTSGWWVGTFHAISTRILRKHAEMVGLKPDFTILDTDDQIRLIKQILEAENIDTNRTPPRAVRSMIDMFKDKALTPDKVSWEIAGDLANGRMPQIYRTYQERLANLNACDFGDLLLHCITLFQNNPDVLTDYQNRFRYLMVDEYQDTNVAQYLWLRLLAQKHKNICCVGDDDQSIYGWRGAEVGNILRFDQDFPGAKTIRLEENYRSSGHILGAASGLIEHNRDRHGKTLWTKADDGEKIHVKNLWDGEDEARWVGSEIENLIGKGISPTEISILVRAGFQTREFEERFLMLGIPYKVIGGMRFYERQEIRDVLAYLRLISQPADDLAYERIINVPKRGLGPATVQKIHEFARNREVSMLEATGRMIQSDELKPKPRSTLSNFIRDIARWREEAQNISPSELCDMVLVESGYLQMWRDNKAPDAPTRVENLKEMVTALTEFETLLEFLEHVSLVTANDEASDASVSIMTLHGAKGLEFDHVFLPGWEEGVFPSGRALEEGPKRLEEERRLAYVGITRARKKAYISSAGSRQLYGRWTDCIPSRFLNELPDDHIVSDGGAIRSHHTPIAASRDELYYGSTHDRGPLIQGQARRVSTQAQAPYRTGSRVMHDDFGPGIVQAIQGQKLDILFDNGEHHRVMASFVSKIDV